MSNEPVEFAVEGAIAPARAAGVLRLAAGTRSAVVIADCGVAPEGRGHLYARALEEAGVSSLLFDAGPAGPLARPAGLADGFALVFGAFRHLTAHAEIDALRIGVLGFPPCAALALLTATRAVARRYLRNGERFAAHAPIHPLCSRYNKVDGFELRDLTGAPILLHCGAEDDDDPPGALDALLGSLDAFDRDSIRPLVAPRAQDFDRPDATVAFFRDTLRAAL